jgi:SnoaL-like domain
MLKPREVVLAFQNALGKGDFAGARKLLQDNLEFRGPFDTFHKADDYLHALQKLRAIVERVDIKKVFEDGSDVSLFCDLVTKTVGNSFVAELYQVRDERLCLSGWYSTRGRSRRCSQRHRLPNN